ncbi:MAG: hypothetical protein WBK28_02785 [Minisyncoccia bacterium]
MKKITNWIFKSKEDLPKKWWHRFIKVLFILATIAYGIYLISFLVTSYSRVVHEWSYVDSVSSRLNKEPYSGKVVSIHNLYGDSEVISEKYAYQMDGSLAGKRVFEPFSAIFLEDSQSFCSDELYKHIGNIASTNGVKLFSTANPTFERLYADVDVFSTYLENNSFSIKCVMLDSYTITNENDTTSTFPFLRPVETSDYSIYSYKDNTSGFILLVLLSAVFFLFCILCTILIYYKVILYIVYGKIEKPSSKE